MSCCAPSLSALIRTPNVCNRYASDIRGPPPQHGLSFFVFDSFGKPDAPFTERYAIAEATVRSANVQGVLMTPQFEVDNASDLDRVEAEIVGGGFEGGMLRKPDAPYHLGSCSTALSIECSS